MFQLYDYQEQSVIETRSSFQNGSDATILCIPTGGGKTVVFSHIAKSAISLGNTVMIVCDRKELIDQAYKKATQYGLWPTIIMPGKRFVKSSCYIASVDTFLRRKMNIDIDLLIIDEAHKAKFDKLVDQYKGKCPIIGATATPVRIGSQRCLSTLYDDIVNPVSVNDLISKNKLTPAVYYAAKVDLSELKTDRLEYDSKQLFDFYNKQTLYDGVVDNYEKFCKGEPTIVFNVNREHSKKTVEEFLKRGIRAAHVDGSFSKFDRDRILNRFKHGGIDVLCNCNILTTGYDEDRIKNVMVNRATKSLSLWLQMCGRGGRISDGKEEFRIIDMGSNCANLGFWDDDREWSLHKKKKKSSEGTAPVKDCPQCEALIHASKPSCPHCYYIFPKKERELAVAEFQQIAKNDIPDHLRKPFSDMNFHELDEYRRIKGYKSGWVHIQMALRKSSKKQSKSINRR